MADNRSSPLDDEKVRIENVTKRYGDVLAVDDVSFSIKDREFLTLLGPSGAGKSTLLELIAGFIQPTDGEIYIDDDPISVKAPYERSIGMVFQGMALFPHMTVKENIAFPLEMRRFDPNSIDDKVTEMLELVELPGYEDRKPSELSGGQQQRIAIARALAFEPELLLLDEPLSSLDKKLRDTMREELLRIHDQTDVTTIHVTHNQEEALSMADRIAVVNEGTIEQLSTTQKLYSQPKTPFIADFIGNSNMLHGQVTDVDDEIALVDLDSTLSEVKCRCSTEISPDETVSVSIRYEDAQISESKLNTENSYRAEITQSVFKGDTISYTVKFGPEDDRLFQISVPHNQRSEVLERGKTVYIGWDASDALLFPE